MTATDEPLRRARRLQRRAAAYREHLAEIEAARDDAIREAYAAGASHARIAEATGLTRSRVGQIALGASRT